MYSQNNEEEIIMGYFGDRTGRLLDIGANDGITFSNSAKLLELGWCGVLLEPSTIAHERLTARYAGRPDILTAKAGIADFTGDATLHESGSWQHTGPDQGLFSCIDPKEKERWGNTVAWSPAIAKFYTFDDFLKFMDSKNIRKFEFITIDAEGYDWKILQQMDLAQLGCQCLCIEYNSHATVAQLYQEYAGQFGMHQLSINAENIIFGK